MEGVWKHGKALLYALSIASLAGNIVALMRGPQPLLSAPQSMTYANSLRGAMLWKWPGTWTLAATWHYVERHLHGLSSPPHSDLLLYFLLNCIVLVILVKSGFLARVAAGGDAGERESERGKPGGLAIFGKLGGGGEEEDFGEDMVVLSSLCMNPREEEGEAKNLTSSGQDEVLATAADPTVVSTSESKGQKGNDIQRQMEVGPSPAPPRKRESLFTIEPIEPSITTNSTSDTESDSDSDADTYTTTTTYTTSSLTSTSTSASANKPNKSHKVKTKRNNNNNNINYYYHNHNHNHSNGYDDDDDYGLDRHQFNERVESFITKFKRNLTMQREASLTRLLGLLQPNNNKKESP